MSAFERMLAALFAPCLRRRAREALVLAALEGLPYAQAPRPALPRVRVAVVQFDLGLTLSAAAFARHVYALVRQAVEGGAGLVVFPEYASLPLLGLVPGVPWLARMLEKRLAHTAAEAEHQGEGGGVEDLFGPLLRLAAPVAVRVYRATFGTLAARFGVTIVGGSAIELGADGRLHNAAYLYGPGGEELGRQEKTHLMPVEVAMGFGAGTEIQPADTPAGRLAFPVCMDHTYFETARIAALAGADLLIDPSANIGYYDPYAQARGVWNRVQEVRTYGLLCSGIGRLPGLLFEGKSGVYAPLAMTPAGDGVLAEARTADEEEVVFADLDYAALHAYQARDPLELNVALYRRYLPAAYGSVR